jgi:flagellar biosynthesis/type III secretory pathway protein FliH
MKLIILSIAILITGCYIGPKSSEIEAEKRTAYNSGYQAGYEAGLKEGKETGYEAGYTQGTEYGKSLILSEIDTRIQEAERTNKNTPLFRVRR